MKLLSRLKRKHKKSPHKTIAILEIKPIVTIDTSVLSYFNRINGEEIKNIPTGEDFLQKNHQNFKKLSENNKLKILFLYIQVNTQNGLYKRESLQAIGKYFGNVDKNTIKKRLDKLEDMEYIRKVTDLDLKEAEKTYKVLKDVFTMI